MDEDYEVQLRGDTTQYQQSMQSSVSVTDALTASLGRLGTGLQNLWQRTNRKLTLFAVGEVAGITAATAAAGKLESQMTQLHARNVMLGQSTNTYTGSVTKLRSEFGLTSTDVIGLITQLNQLQVPLSQQQATVQNYVKLSAVTGENVNVLANSQQNFMRSMGSSQSSVQRYSSMLATLNSTTGAGASATADFASNIAPISKVLGLNTSQIAGVSAAFVKAGQDGYAAANVYTKIMSDINRAAQYGGPEIKVYSDLLGTSVERFKQMPKSEAITEIFETLNKQGPQAIKTLESLGLEGVRNQRALQAVFQQGGLRQAIGSAQEGYSNTDKFSRASSEALKGLNAELGTAKQNFRSFAEAIGSVFLPVATTVVHIFNTIFSALAPIGTFLANLPAPLKTAIALFAGLGVAANFLPKIAAGLASLGIVGQATRGPLSQGVRTGWRPDRPLNPAQLAFEMGEGAAGPRAMYRAGRGFAGSLSPRARELRASGISVPGMGSARLDEEGMARTPLGTRIVQGGRSGLISAMEFGGDLARSQLIPTQWGYVQNPATMHKGYIGESMLTTKPSYRAAITESETWRRLANSRVGKWAASDEPGEGRLSDWWSRRSGNFIPGVSPVDLGPTAGMRIGAQVKRFAAPRSELGDIISKISSAGMGGGAPDVLTKLNDTLNNIPTGGGQETTVAKESTKAKKEETEAARDATKATKANAEETKRAKTVMGTLGSEAAKTSRFLAGGIAGGANLAGRGVGAVATRVGPMLGGLAADLGPIGLGIAAIGGMGWVKSKFDDEKKAAQQGMQDDLSAGSGYRDALGLAKNDLMSFADVVKDATKSLDVGAQTMNQAMTVSAADITASAKTKDIQDPYLATRPSADNAARYASAVLRGSGGNIQVSEAMKLDLIKLLGPNAAQNALNQAGQMTSTGVASTLAGAQPWWEPWASGGLQEATKMTTSTMAAGVAQGARTGGSRGAAGAFWGNIGDLGTAYMTSRGKKWMGLETPGNMAVQRELINTGAAAMGLTSKEDQKAWDTLVKTTSNEVLNREKAAGKPYTETERQDLFNQLLYQGATSTHGVHPMASTKVGQVIAGYYQTGGNQIPSAAAQASRDTYDLISKPTWQQTREQAWGTPEQIAEQAKNSPWLSRLMNQGVYETGGTMAYGPGGPANWGPALASGSPAASAAAAAVIHPENAQLQARGAEAMFADVMKQAGGDYQRAGAILDEMAASASSTNTGFQQLIASTDALRQAQQNYVSATTGKNTLADQGGRAAGDFGAQYTAYRNMVRRGASPDELAPQRTKVEDARKQATTAALAINDWMTNMANQYVQFDLQRKQGEQSMERTQGRQLRDFTIQQSQQLEDYHTQRSNAEEDFAIQRQRNLESYHISRQRQDQAYNRQRSREEEDHATQIVRLAEDSAKQVYNTYQRITVERTWDAANLLQNMQQQQQAIQTQRSNLGTVRRLGLSNRAITQLGLSDSGNAQQLQRLMQGLQQDPDLVRRYNAMATSRQGAAGALAMDPANATFARSEADRKKNLKHQREDYAISADQQRQDMNRQMNQSAADFLRATGRMDDQFERMRRRQMEALHRGWKDMRADFNYQMNLQLESISSFAQQSTKTFKQNYDIVSAHTRGVTHQQTKDMNAQMALLDLIAKTNVDELDKIINLPYSQWGAPNVPQVSPSGPPSGRPGQNATQGGAHAAGGSRAASGGPNDGSAGSVQSYSHIGSSSGTHRVMDWPVTNHRVGTPWGKPGAWKGSRTLGPGYHSGADFPVGSGTQVHAIEDGTVSSAGWNGAYGNMIDLNHGGGIHTWYAHNSKLNVSRGQHVTAGEVISLSGATGRAFGPHLHLELVVNGKDRDPIPWLQSGGAQVPGGGAGGAATTVAAAPTKPDFTKLTEKWEKFITPLNYLDKQRRWFHSGRAWRPGDLAYYIGRAWDRSAQASGYSGGGGGGGFSGPADAGGKGGARGVWNALRSAGLSKQQAAGIMGNMVTESGFSWNIVQGGSHSDNPASAGGAGYGLVQWTPGRKLSQILASGHKKNSLEGQVWALMHQLSGAGPYSEGQAGKMVRAAGTVFEAARAFMLGYERPANQSSSAISGRAANAAHIYNQFKAYGNGVPAAPPGWAVVGEHGYEFVKLKGGEEVRNHAQSAAMVKGAATVTPKASVTNNHYDSSTSFAGAEITVQATDVNAFLSELQTRQRLAALTKAKK